MSQRDPDLRLWDTTRPFLAFARTLTTLPRLQLFALSLDFAARTVRHFGEVRAADNLG